MENTRKRLDRQKRHAQRLSREALGGAGTRRAVGRALGRSEATVSHDVTDRYHPDAYRLFAALVGSVGTTGRAFADACAEAVELSEIVTAEDEDLTRRGLYLLEWEDELCRREDQAALRRSGHAAALRRVASASAELAMILDECAERGIDLYALLDARQVAA